MRRYTIHCGHWSDGDCRLDLHGGRPSPGLCEACAVRDGEGPRVSWSDVPETPFDGSLAWAEMHRRALAFTGDATVERDYLNQMAVTLPCGACRDHFALLLMRSPPDFTTAQSYFASTVGWHNAVNERLGRSPMSLAEAKERWSRRGALAPPG